jgi:formylglycine-generating enzyme
MAGNSEWLLSSSGHEGSVEQYLDSAKQHQAAGERHMAATAYDRAWSLNPQDAAVTSARRELLDEMSLKLANIVFRYIPGGSFLMGSEHGEADEKPVHIVQLAPFWISEAPISWARYCEILDWVSPPEGHPKTPVDSQKAGFHLHQENKIRLQYCEDYTLRARDWHAHVPEHEWLRGKKKVKAREIFGEVRREPPDSPWEYDQKPMVAVSWQSAQEFCDRFSEQHRDYHCRLPTEAEWEKAARGGLVGATYSWGNEPADPDRCDFNRFDSFSIQPPRRFIPNGYGLYGMCGGVWEWTADWYDADYYQDSPRLDPTGPADRKEKVLRGGSWADCAEAVTVSFRYSRPAAHWQEETWGAHYCPNIGFRICCLGTV